MNVVGAISTAEALSLLIAAIALALGLWNGYREWALRKQIARKERQANVRVILDTEAKPGCEQLVLINDGPAAARRIHVVLDGESLLHHPWFQGQHEIPGALGAHARYPCDIIRQGDKPTEVVVTWADGSSEERDYQTTIQPGPQPTQVGFYSF